MTKKKCSHSNVGLDKNGKYRCVDCGAPAKFPGETKRTKYGNVVVKYGDLTFHSKAELKRWIELEQLQRAGKITDLQRQVPYDLVVNDVLITIYIADFVYKAPDALSECALIRPPSKWDGYVIEDVKSKATVTDVFRLKRKLMKAIKGIDILITGKGT